MSTGTRARRMTLLDATPLVGSAAIGLGLFELAHRSLFKGWIWLIDLGIGDIRTWTTMRAIAATSDVAAFLLPIVIAWTFLLLLLRV